MKKAWAFLLTLAMLCLSLSGCAGFETENVDADPAAVLEEGVEYPLYHSLGKAEKQLYVNICAAVREHRTTAAIGVYETEKETDEAVETVKKLYRQIFFEQSDIFWVDPYDISMSKVRYGGGYRLVLEPAYLVGKDEAEAMKETLAKRVEEIVEQAEEKDGDFEKVLFVHDSIVGSTEYDHELAENGQYDSMGINAYGCLVEGKTICSGYTLAFDLIMKKLGYECGAEFNNYQQFSLFDGHVWNYCKLGGDYYYFDLTWDDTGFDSEAYKKYFEYSYTYFGISREEFLKTNYFMADDAPTPRCDGGRFNYYVYRGLNLPVYTKDAAKAAIEAQAAQSYAVLRFDSYSELLKAQSELIADGEIFSMVSGIQKVSYTVSKSNLHLFIFFE